MSTNARGVTWHGLQQLSVLVLVICIIGKHKSLAFVWVRSSYFCESGRKRDSSLSPER